MGQGLAYNNEKTYHHMYIVNTISIVNHTVFKGGNAGTVGGGVSYTIAVLSQNGIFPTERGIAYILKNFILSIFQRILQECMLEPYT